MATPLLSDVLLGDGSGPPFLLRESVVPRPLVDRLRTESLGAVQADARYHGGTDYPGYGRVLECTGYGGSFLDLLACDDLFAPVEEVLGNDAVLFTMVASCVPPNGSNIGGEPHADITRVDPWHLTHLPMLVLLDDVTTESAATVFLPGRLDAPGPPSAEELRRTGTPVTGPAGSVCYFHPRRWHGALPNRTGSWRCCLIPAMTRAWCKQRFDLPRMVPAELRDALPANARRRLGMLAGVPASYDEYYDRGRAGTHFRL